MTDVFKNFTGNVTTSSQEMFAVPISNVANNEPVTTYVAKSIYIVHSVPSPSKTQFTLTHFDASANASISLVAESKTTDPLMYWPKALMFLNRATLFCIR